MQRRFLQLFFILGIALIAVYYWRGEQAHDVEQSNLAMLEKLPKSYLVNTRRMQYAEDGSLAEILEAQRADKYEVSDLTLFQQPRFYAHHGDSQTWSASALRGQLVNSSRVLTLTDQVVLTADQRDAKLETQEMVLDLPQKTAQSKVPVTITQGDNITRAQGMSANLPAERLELKPNVESIYVLSRS